MGLGRGGTNGQNKQRGSGVKRLNGKKYREKSKRGEPFKGSLKDVKRSATG